MAAGIRKWPEHTLEARAYAAVEDIPTVDMNDRNRLGYHVWLYLRGEFSSLDEALRIAQPRLRIDAAEALRRIRERLDSPTHA